MSFPATKPLTKTEVMKRAVTGRWVCVCASDGRHIRHFVINPSYPAVQRRPGPFLICTLTGPMWQWTDPDAQATIQSDEIVCIHDTITEEPDWGECPTIGD